ncbi:helix-turn-helix domain-containing protein [Singulisphaera rosea]
MTASTTDSQRVQWLRHFGKESDGRLSAGELRKKLKLASGKGADVDPILQDADRTIVEMLESGVLSVAGGAKEGLHPRPNATYRITDKGRDQLKPPRPDFADEQLQAQEAFILLQVFRAREGRLTRSDLNGKLKTRAAVGQLEFDVKAAPAVVDYHLAMLVDKGNLVEQRRGVSVVYSLDPDSGPKALASVKQHDGVSFTMSGETLNSLLAAARSSGTSAETPAHVPAESVETTPPAPALAPTSLSPDDISRHVATLQAGTYAGKDLIPIYEVRRIVAQHHGAHAADHTNLDPVLKQMRADGQLRLLAISNSQDATQDQLDDSIPGMNQTLFYIVAR